MEKNFVGTHVDGVTRAKAIELARRHAKRQARAAGYEVKDKDGMLFGARLNSSTGKWYAEVHVKGVKKR